MRLPAGSLTPAPLHAPESHMSPTSRPASSSFAFAAATSRTRSAIVAGGSAGELVVVRVRRHHREGDVSGLVLDPVVAGGVRILREAEQFAVEAVRCSMSVTGTRM